MAVFLPGDGPPEVVLLRRVPEEVPEEVPADVPELEPVQLHVVHVVVVSPGVLAVLLDLDPVVATETVDPLRDTEDLVIVLVSVQDPSRFAS